MEQKEIKALLKSVKELIDQKDFKSAIKTCKTILKTDRNNYMALVFFGVCLQETEQRSEAPKAFKKATEVSPEQQLAWRGLSSYYEKYGENKYKLEQTIILMKLYDLETDEKLIADCLKKFQEFLSELSEDMLPNVFLETSKIKNEQKKLKICLLLLNRFSNIKGFTPESMKIFSDLLQELYQNTNLLEKNDKIEVQKKYFKMLYMNRDLTTLVKEASNVCNLYKTEMFPLEWICKVYIEYFVSDSLRIHENIEEISSKLLASSPDSYLGLLCKGINSIQDDMLQAIECIKLAVKKYPLYFYSWVLCAQVQIQLYNFIDAEYSINEALALFNKSNASNEVFDKCKLLEIEAHVGQETVLKCNKAVSLCKELENTNLEMQSKIMLLSARSYFVLKEFDKASKCLELVENVCELEKCLLMLKIDNHIDVVEKLNNLAEKFPNESSVWLELGKAQYSNDTFKLKSINSFLKSAKLNPWCYWSFVYLGHIYKNLIVDLEKARRCYQRAFQLNPRSSDAGIGLSDVYTALGKHELNKELLTIATGIPGSKWAWLRLGLNHFNLNEQDVAVECLRVAIRVDQSDEYCWECLADVYLSKKMYTSAMKCYEKVVELNSSLLYPVLQIAKIERLLGLYEESVSKFRSLIKQNPDYIPALIEHAESCFASMKNFINLQLNGLAGDRCQELVYSLVKCLEVRNDMLCVWKLLGDSCTLLSELSAKYCVLSVPAWLVTSVGNSSITSVGNSSITSVGNSSITITRTAILDLGTKCYLKMLSIHNTWSEWYDLAVHYNTRAVLCETDEERSKYKQLSCTSVKRSIRLMETWHGWNLLGILAASKEINDPELAQHSFIKATMLDEHNPVTWSNLGVLYLQLGDLILANQSFTESQKCDCDYVRCWIGQAMLAELTGHEDAMDLYRHSTQLGTNEEGCTGYSNMVCSTLINTRNKQNRGYLYNIKNMNAVVVACDLMTWYTDKHTNDACAYNMLGLLLERQNLYRRSCDAYANSVRLLEESQSVELDQVRCNYGRVLLKLKKCQDALEQYKLIKKANFVNQCGLADVYLTSELYEDAYNTYQSTLEWFAPDNCHKSQLLVAMAAVVYMFQGQDDAKLLLMQACQLKPPSVHGLYACCALGMLHSNLSMSELALKELSKHEDVQQDISEFTYFNSYIHLLKGDNVHAVRAMCKMTHRHPHDPKLWLSLSMLLLHLYPMYDGKSAGNCANVALVTGRSKIDVSKVMSLASLSHLLSGSGISSVRSSQKAVHMNPDVIENWIVLIASIVARNINKPSVKNILWLRKIINFVRRKLQTSKQITKWLSNYERKVAQLADELIKS